MEIPNHRHCRLLRARRERPCYGSATERGYELPSSDVNCHLPRPHRDHACRNTGKNIMHHLAGLA